MTLGCFRRSKDRSQGSFLCAGVPPVSIRYQPGSASNPLGWSARMDAWYGFEGGLLGVPPVSIRYQLGSVSNPLGWVTRMDAWYGFEGGLLGVPPVSIRYQLGSVSNPLGWVTRMDAWYGFEGGSFGRAAGVNSLPTWFGIQPSWGVSTNGRMVRIWGLYFGCAAGVNSCSAGQ